MGPRPAGLGDEEVSFLGKVSRNLLGSVDFIRYVSTMPAHLEELTFLPRPAFYRDWPVQHAIAYIYDDDFLKLRDRELDRFPFAVILDLRGIVSPGYEIISRPGHVIWRQDQVAQSDVLAHWRATAEQALPRIAPYWPPDVLQLIRNALVDPGEERPIPEPLSSQMYLWPNSILANLAKGLWGSDAMSAQAPTEPTDNIVEAQRRMAKAAALLRGIVSEKHQGLTRRPEAYVVVPSINPAYFSGLSARLGKVVRTPAIFDRIGSTHGYKYYMPEPETTEGASAIRGLLNERRLELGFWDAIAMCAASRAFDAVYRSPYLPSNLFHQLERLVGIEWDDRSLPKFLRRWRSFGGRMSELLGETLINEFKGYRRIVALSDLPLEWAMIDGAPLGFLIPISRIPLVPGNLSARLIVERRPAIIWTKKEQVRILIVDGHDHKDPLKVGPRSIRDVAPQLGFSLTYVEVRNGEELNAALEKYLPNIVYVSAHGRMLEGIGSAIQFADEHVTFETGSLGHVPEIAIVSACRSDPVVRTYGSPASRLLGSGVRTVLASYANLTEPHASLVAIALLTNLAAAIDGEVPHLDNWWDVVVHVLRSRRPLDILLAAERWAMRNGKTTARPAIELFEPYTLEYNRRPPSVRGGWSEVPNLLIEVARHTPHAEAVSAVVNRDLFRPESQFYTLLGYPDSILLGPRWSRASSFKQ